MRFFVAQPLGYSIQTAEIDNDAVTAAKIAQGTAGQILMSDATPDTNWKTMSGDATIDGAGALTIGNDKIDSQHYAAASIDNEHLADDAVGLAEMAAGTAGNLITYDASGNPAAVATGTSGQILTSNGAGAAPTFQAAAGGGNLVLKASYVVSGSAVTQIDLSSLDIATDGAYLLVVEYKSGGNYLRLEYNDDNTASNYRYIQHHTDTSAGNTANSGSDALVGISAANTYSEISGLIVQDADGFIRYTGHSYDTTRAQRYHVRTNAAFANLTKINLVGSATDIAVGTKVYLYKVTRA